MSWYRAEVPSEPQGLPPSVVRIQRLTKAWLADLAIERGLSPHTRAAYAKDLEHFAVWLAQRKIDLQAVTPPHLDAFLGDRAARGEARRTRARRAASLRGFFRFLEGTGLLDTDPARLLPAPKKPDPLPKALDLKAVQGLLKAADAAAAKDPARGRRAHLVLQALYAAGLRASELSGLDLADVDQERGLLRVVGKGRKERRLPMLGPLAGAMERWLSGGRPRLLKDPTEQALLLTDRGQRLTRHGIYRIVKELALAAGLDPKAMSPHTLRHTFATHLVKGGADLRAVQELLGHASIDTTEIYTKLAPDHLRDAHRRFHPRA